ncbi:MAG: hypothetical protein Q7W30_10055 [Coriobacteriia bacterium]|nr:hypothetical protein [Coriobacteriia bacterium]
MATERQWAESIDSGVTPTDPLEVASAAADARDLQVRVTQMRDRQDAVLRRTTYGSICLVVALGSLSTAVASMLIPGWSQCAVFPLLAVPIAAIVGVVQTIKAGAALRDIARDGRAFERSVGDRTENARARWRWLVRGWGAAVLVATAGAILLTVVWVLSA